MHVSDYEEALRISDADSGCRAGSYLPVLDDVGIVEGSHTPSSYSGVRIEETRVRGYQNRVVRL